MNEYWTAAHEVERKSLIAALKSTSERLKAEKRGFTNSERLAVNGHLKRLDELKHIPNPRQTAPDQLGGGMTVRQMQSLGGGRNGGKRYADMFGLEQLSSDGWSSPEEFLATIHSGLHHPLLRHESLTMVGGTPSAGGWAAPEEFVAQMLDKSLESEIVRPRCQVEPMASDTKKISGLADTDHTGGSLYGGFTASWMSEKGTATELDAELRRIELHAKKLAIFTRASNEVIADGVSFEQMLGGAIVAAIGWHLDYAALRGTGSGQPLGVLNDPALITIAKETSQPANTILYQNLTKMFARVHPACINNSVWIANSATIPQLLELSVAVGTGGSHIPVLQESGGQFTMLTRPVIFTEKLPALGTKGDLLLADLSQYTLGLRREMSVEKSVHVGWANDTSGYRCILRADGMGRWRQALTPAAGDSLSWCAALATRA